MRIRFLPVLVAILVLTACGARVPDAAPAELGADEPLADVLLEAEGAVSILPLGETAWQSVDAAALLDEGDGIRTGSESAATITFPDGSVARLNAEAEVYLLLAPNADASAVTFDLVTGEVWSRIEQLAPNGSYSVQTPTALAVVRGTEFSVITSDEGTDVATYESVVDVSVIEDLSSIDPDADPLITPLGAVETGGVLQVSNAEIARMRAVRRALKEAGKDFRASQKPALAPKPMGEALHARAWLDRNRALPRGPRRIAPEERATLQARTRRPVLDATMKRAVLEELRAKRLRADELPGVMPLLQQDAPTFLRDPRAFLRAKRAALRSAPSQTAPARSEPPAPASQPSVFPDVDLSSVRALARAAASAPEDADVLRKIVGATLTAVQRTALQDRGLLVHWIAMKAAAAEKNGPALARSATALLAGL